MTEETPKPRVVKPLSPEEVKPKARLVRPAQPAAASAPDSASPQANPERGLAPRHFVIQTQSGTVMAGTYVPPPAPRRVEPKAPEPTVSNSSKPRVITPRNAPVSQTAIRPSQSKIPVDGLVEAAKQINEQFASHPRFKIRLRTILELNPRDYVDVGQRSLTDISNKITVHTQLTTELARLRVSEWIEETKEAASKPPSFMDKFLQKPKPAYYAAQLTNVRAAMQPLRQKVREHVDELVERFETLRLDALALQTIKNTTTTTNATDLAIIDNRVRVMLASVATAEMLKQSLDNADTAILTYMQTIDQLLSITIPNWELAAAKA